MNTTSEKKPYLFMGGPWHEQVHEILPTSQHVLRGISGPEAGKVERYYRHCFGVGQNQWHVYLHNGKQPPAEIILNAIRACGLLPDNQHRPVLFDQWGNRL